MPALANMVWAFEIKPPPVVIEGKEKERQAEMNLSEDAFDEVPVKSAKAFKVVFLPPGEARLQIVKQKWLAQWKA